jgi:hypothetical protein
VAEFLGIRNLFEVCIRDVAGRGLRLDCQELQTTLYTSVTDAPGAIQEKGLIVGIRSEGLTILPPEDPGQDKDNLLQGKVTGIFEKGASHTILFLPHGASRNIEIEVPDHAYQGLNLFEGKGVHVLLRGGCLFFLRKRGVEESTGP